MALARVSQARYQAIHNRVSDAFATNRRTGIEYPVQVEPPILRPLGNEMIYATHVLALNDQDWVSGDFFQLRWRKLPGKTSSWREIKFIVPQEDGVPWLHLVVIGTIDVA